MAYTKEEMEFLQRAFAVAPSVPNQNCEEAEEHQAELDKIYSDLKGYGESLNEMAENLLELVDEMRIRIDDMWKHI